MKRRGVFVPDQRAKMTDADTFNVKGGGDAKFGGEGAGRCLELDIILKCVIRQSEHHCQLFVVLSSAEGSKLITDQV